MNFTRSSKILELLLGGLGSNNCDAFTLNSLCAITNTGITVHDNESKTAASKMVQLNLSSGIGIVIFAISDEHKTYGIPYVPRSTPSNDPIPPEQRPKITNCLVTAFSVYPSAFITPTLVRSS